MKRNTWCGALLIALLLSTPGCMRYRQNAREVTPAASAGCADMARGCGKTVWNLAWGLAQLNEPPRAECGKVGLQEVTVRTTPPLFVVGLVTLGLVTPQRVEWKCAAPAPVEGEFGAAPPAAGA